MKHKIILLSCLLITTLFGTSALVFGQAESPDYSVGDGSTLGDDGLSTPIENCDPLTVSNGTVASYPDCTITCDSGYTLSDDSCVTTSGGSPGGGSPGGGSDDDDDEDEDDETDEDEDTEEDDEADEEEADEEADEAEEGSTEERISEKNREINRLRGEIDRFARIREMTNNLLVVATDQGNQPVETGLNGVLEKIRELEERANREMEQKEEELRELEESAGAGSSDSRLERIERIRAMIETLIPLTEGDLNETLQGLGQQADRIRERIQEEL